MATSVIAIDVFHIMFLMPYCWWVMQRFVLFLSPSSELTQIIADVSQDPTLPRTEDHPCPKYVSASQMKELKDAVKISQHITRLFLHHAGKMCLLVLDTRVSLNILLSKQSSDNN